MVDSSILELLRAEVEEALEPLASAFACLAAEQSGSEAFSSAADEAANQVEGIRIAAEAAGLLGLEAICERFRDNLAALPAADGQASRTLEDSLLLWPERVLEYLYNPASSPACQQLAALIHGPGWPEPFLEHELELLAELLAATSGEGMSPDDGDARLSCATAESVSLVPGEGVNLEVLAAFLEDAPQQAAELSFCLQGLDRANDPAPLLDRARRVAHTLKGAAGVAGIVGVANLTHHLEDLLDYLGRARRQPGSSLMASLSEAADCLETMIEACTGVSAPPENAVEVLQAVLDWAHRMDRGELREAPADAADPAAPDASPAPVKATPFDPPADQAATAEPAAAQSLRVPLEAVDSLFRFAGELSVSNSQIDESLTRILRMQRAIADQDRVIQQRLFELEDLIDIRDVTSTGYRLHQQASADAEDFDPLEMDEYNELHGCSRVLNEAIADSRELQLNVHEELSRLRSMLNQQGRVHQTLGDTILSSRLLPVRTIAARLQRNVRQAARATGKVANLHIEGEDLALDTELLQALIDPLNHLLRNAVDHGLEPTAARAAAGKPQEGSIQLMFRRDGNTIEIVCADDGPGLNLEAVRWRAVERGLLQPETQPDQESLMRMILLPGFSTRDRITQLSGRGVGLDVVHDRVRRLKGTLEVQSTPGLGVRFVLRVPSALVTVHVLLLEAGGQTLAIPSADLQRVPTPGSWTMIEEAGASYFEEGGLRHPARSLAAAMGRRAPLLRAEAHAPVVLASVDGSTLALTVDRLLGSAEVVIKGFGQNLPQVRGVLGAAILGDGAVAPVLDLAGLLQAPAEDMQPTDEPAMDLRPEAFPEILVADDSLTVRRSLSLLLQEAGFRVRQARDGIEAVRAVDQQVPDLLLVDLEMPRMNGLELTAHLRSRPQTARLPIVMITSRGMQKHRRQAEAAGVSLFLTKPFQEENLLEIIYALLQVPVSEAG
jgi:chemotaxis protein histidine kinase CheA/ActR/RegA family two-component response regulator